MAPTLKQLRGYKQTTLKRQITTLKIAIQSSDIDVVKAALDKCKAAYNEFETAHDALLASLTSDPEAASTEDDSFTDVQELYLQAYTDANAVINPATKSNTQSCSTELIDVMDAPRVVLETFDGNDSQYVLFMAAFDELVHNKFKSDRAKLTRLYAAH